MVMDQLYTEIISIIEIAIQSAFFISFIAMCLWLFIFKTKTRT